MSKRIFEQKPDLPTALVHYGVKGMHWGVRKDDSGGSKKSSSEKKSTPAKKTEKSDMNAAQKWATRSTQNQIESHKKALSGKGYEGKLALVDKYTWGYGGRFENYHNKSIDQLERSKERIANGEKVVQTILFGPQYTKAPKVKKQKV